MSVTFDKTTRFISAIKRGETEVPFGNGPLPVGMKAKVVGTKLFNENGSLMRCI